jgi:hypothetical protein
MVVNPSSADGLQGCSSAEIDLHGEGPAHCPNAAKVGSVEVTTPLLERPLPGAVYIAKQADNPFNSLLAIYIVVEGQGVIVKLAGHVELDPVTGRLKTTFEENPQLPFEDFKLHFFDGPRAPLTTPSSCGAYAATTQLTSWSRGTPIEPTIAPFTIGTGCIQGFAPSFSAGTTNNQAGADSAFTTTFSRTDQDQNLSAIALTTPPGLLGKLKGVTQCPEPQAGQGECGPESLIGEATTAVGSGSSPYWVKGGKVYLTGPYNGGPFGLSVVVPTTAGPFTLTGNGGPGREIVRASIHVDPHTAQITVLSDPLPTILEGIPLQIKTVNVTINREHFIFNPTNCSPLSVAGTIASTQGAAAGVSSPFNATNCAKLPFKPVFTTSTSGKTSKANGASLVVKVSQKPGEANIHKVNLQLPLVLPARLTTLQKACTEAQFNANPAGCPVASNIGVATAVTPVLNVPLSGPAYLVSHGGAAFPDVEFILQGQGVTIVLDGATDIKKGITYSKFETVPDAPISSFETVLPQGPHSALAANGNLCASTKTVSVRKRVTIHVHGHAKRVTKTVKHTVSQPLTMPTTITGQNGAQVKQNTKISVTGCPKKAKTNKAGKAKHTGKSK